ncbi:MAG: hypothetical protein ACK4QP_08170 [Pseudorhizobium sp.]
MATLRDGRIAVVAACIAIIGFLAIRTLSDPANRKITVLQCFQRCKGFRSLG